MSRVGDLLAREELRRLVVESCGHPAATYVEMVARAEARLSVRRLRRYAIALLGSNVVLVFLLLWSHLP